MSNSRYRSDDSGEDGELSDSEDIVGPSKPRKDGGQLWSEIIQAETLEEGLKTIPSFKDTSNSDMKLVDRGAESFQIPSVSDFDVPEEKRTTKTSPFRTIMSNSLFDDNDSHAEEFGVKTVRTIHVRSEHANNRFKRNKSGPKNIDSDIPQNGNRKRRMNNAISMDSLNSVESHQSNNSTASLNKKKRNRNKRSKPDNAILRSDFSFNKLYKSTIPEGLSIEETGERIAQELGENDTTPVKFAVSTIGVEQALRLFTSTVETEKNGGLKVKFGSRRRTPGGVFFELLRNSNQVDEATKRKIHEFSKSYFNQKQKTV